VGMDRGWKNAIIGFSPKVWLNMGISMNNSLRRDSRNEFIAFFLT